MIYTLPEDDERSHTITTPERIEIGSAQDILNTPDQRQTIKDDIVDVFIAAAMVNPEGRDTGQEWISIANLGAEEVDLSAWTLSDNSNQSLLIGERAGGDEARLKPGESLVVNPVTPLRLSNERDVIKLYDGDGARIDWVNYNKKMVVAGKPVLFLSPRDTLVIEEREDDDSE